MTKLDFFTNWMMFWLVSFYWFFEDDIKIALNFMLVGLLQVIRMRRTRIILYKINWWIVAVRIRVVVDKRALGLLVFLWHNLLIEGLLLIFQIVNVFQFIYFLFPSLLFCFLLILAKFLIVDPLTRRWLDNFLTFFFLINFLWLRKPGWSPLIFIHTFVLLVHTCKVFHIKCVHLFLMHELVLMWSLLA